MNPRPFFLHWAIAVLTVTMAFTGCSGKSEVTGSQARHTASDNPVHLTSPEHDNVKKMEEHHLDAPEHAENQAPRSFCEMLDDNAWISTVLHNTGEMNSPAASGGGIMTKS